VTDPSRLFSIRLYKHTGAVFLWHQQAFTVTGTLQQCESAYRGAQTHCLLAGWWSVVSLFLMNWIALISNFSAIRTLRKLAQQPAGAHAPSYAAVAPPVAAGPPPAWYPNPSGPGQRYWDGANWTAWTHPPGQ
jgi:Protein of unknown function (DUF2510)